MKVAKFWACESTTAENPQGEIYALKRWGHSNRSLAEARELAAQKLRETVEKLRSGSQLRQYAQDYAERTMREELVEEIVDDENRLIGAVTRNRYGALVLNTARLLIADVDNPRPGLLAGLKALFGRKRTGGSVALDRIERFRQAHADYALRVYETHSGYRVMIVDRPFEPTGESTRSVFEQLGCDPLYVKLCRAQESFRARLTPKPWRCGSRIPQIRFPRETAEARDDFERWRRDYEDRSRGFAVCKRLDGDDPPPDPAIERLVQLHDRYVLRPGLPLA